MLEIIKAIILGIIQGITEWLPISSTGHLILFNLVMPLNVTKEFWDLFLVVIQLGSILAVVVIYFNQLNPFSKRKNSHEKNQTYRMWLMIIVASLPLVIGALVDDKIPDSPMVIAATLIIYGILFIVIENWNATRTPKINSINGIDIKTAFLIGCFQLLAIVPGTSRSGATIIGALLLGLSRTAAAEFSFFLAIPAMAGASGLKLLKYFIKTGIGFNSSELILLIVATVVSFVVSMYVIKNLLKFIRKHDFKVFGYYRIVLGIIIFIVFGIKAIIA